MLSAAAVALVLVFILAGCKSSLAESPNSKQVRSDRVQWSRTPMLFPKLTKELRAATLKDAVTAREQQTRAVGAKRQLIDGEPRPFSVFFSDQMGRSVTATERNYLRTQLLPLVAAVIKQYIRVSSASFLADISVRSPRTLFIFII